MKKFTTMMAGFFLPFIALLAQDLPDGLTALTGASVTVTSEDDRSGGKKNRLIVINDTIFFTASTTANGDELWITDGTTENTKMVKDINPGTGNATPRYLAVLGDKLYFQADDGTHGVELWESDGTAAGTKLVSDIYPDANSSEPELLTPLQGKLLFSAKTAVSETDGQKWLHLYNPADGSVTLVKSGVWPKNTGDSNYEYIQADQTHGKAYFTGQTKGFNDEVWVTDGTSTGTHVIKDITPESLGSSAIQWVYNFKDQKVVWRQKTPRGYANAFGGDSTLYVSHLNEQIWVSDGTEAGTHMLEFIDKAVAGDGEGTSTQMAWQFTYNDKLYFRTDDGSHGVELWVSNAEDTTNTMLFKDINPGSANSWAEDWAVFKGKLCFNADAGGDSYGAEPHFTDGTLGQVNLIYNLQPGNASSWSRKFKVLQINGVDSMLFGVGGLPSIQNELWMVSSLPGEATIIDCPGTSSDPFNLTPMGDALYFATKAVKTLYKYKFTPAPVVDFLTTVEFNNSNYHEAQPLVMQKRNLEYFLDPELEVSVNDPSLQISTDKETWGTIVLTGTGAVDTIWVKGYSIHPDNSFKNIKISTSFYNLTGKAFEASALINCFVEPVIRGNLKYLVEAGKADPSTIEEGESMGTSQSVVDQPFGADPVTGKHWGYEFSTWGKDDGADKWGGLRENNQGKMDTTITYKFEVDNGEHAVYAGYREFWSGRTFIADVNGQKDTIALNPTTTRVVKMYKVNVSDNLITVKSHRVQDNPIITWIKIAKADDGYDACYDPTCEARVDEYNSTGVKQISIAGDFKVFPSPSNGLINITTDDDFNSVEVIGLDGKLVKSQRITENHFSLSIDKKGIYFIRMKGNDNVAIQKVVIQ